MEGKRRDRPGRRHHQGAAPSGLPLELPDGNRGDYDRATAGRLWLTGRLHLQDTVTLGRMDLDDVIDALYAVLRWDIAASGPGVFNLC